MTRDNENVAQHGVKTAWSVVVAYEDTAAREQAVDFCDQLVRRFWARFEFEVSWWSFNLLQAEHVALEAADKAARADLIILSSVRQDDLPAVVKGWIENWLTRRGDCEGILAGLMGQGTAADGLETHNHYYLRQVAHRGGMDYLTQLPQNISRLTPESPESYTRRAAQVTSVLDEILHHQAPPPAMT
jgi:hypothetical protein